MTRRDFLALLVLQSRLTQDAWQNQGYSTSPILAWTWITLRSNPICVPIILVYNIEMIRYCWDLKRAFRENFVFLIFALSSITSGFLFCFVLLSTCLRNTSLFSFRKSRDEESIPTMVNAGTADAGVTQKDLQFSSHLLCAYWNSCITVHITLWRGEFLLSTFISGNTGSLSVVSSPR